uniref:Reverse transcriptase domain-containing protein n=1 Tax=Cacopsylla melanoneura TaxID=428564 RepID=A0A8D8QBX8_9HEMI
MENKRHRCVFYRCVKQTKTFKYLGSCITEDGKSSSDVRQRIGQAKAAFHKKKTLFCSNNMNIELRKQLIKSLVWSVALYGAETWTVSKNDKKRIQRRLRCGAGEGC